MGYLLADVWTVDAPQEGTWEAVVTGANIPGQGVPLYVSMTLDSDVVAIGETHSATYAENSQILVTASLVDAGTKVIASAASAEITGPSGAPSTIQLNDSETDGDETASDKVYSGTFIASGCGSHSVKVSLTGQTSEGTSQRVRNLSPTIIVPNDAAGDPCDADEDDDTIVDSLEVDTYQSDPFEVDTDRDGCDDGVEVQTAPGSQTSGGLRDPVSFWDFYDVWTGTVPNLTRNGAVAGTDFFAVLGRFGTTGAATSVEDALTEPPSATGYHAVFDRGAQAGPNIWDRAPADGAIAGTDFFAMLGQFGHICA
jgi:hypothetical protein